MLADEPLFVNAVYKHLSHLIFDYVATTIYYKNMKDRLSVYINSWEFMFVQILIIKNPHLFLL